MMRQEGGMADIKVGIGGWTFPPWRGTFYPEGLPHAKELAFAAGQVTAIEINATFYGRQKPESFAKWRDAVPDGFTFAVKASRFTTHKRDLADAGDSVRAFCDSGISVLGRKLGPVLWQFPPTRRFDRETFAAFIGLLPAKQGGTVLRHAFEVRHESFADPAYLALLREHNVAHAIVESDKHVQLPEVTADFVYARLERNSGAEPEGYAAAALDAWAAQVRSWKKDAFVFFIGGDKVRAPDAARAFLRRL